ncbi:hypothetical protein HNR31_002682 [Anoxybacillus caldiproteolyticus]|uniref:Uncharacterized protein n=1 Tax=Thermaerobacillus caldiproteolyticus TaxID=247480 RepID=A0A7W0BZC2_9BACL|nr:hypothetical protein [Anoxybacillus caldiproteolyticus]
MHGHGYFFYRSLYHFSDAFLPHQFFLAYNEFETHCDTYSSEMRTNIHLWRMFLSSMEADIVFSSIGVINTIQRMRLKSLQP